jgi:CRISPR-associated protein Cas1
MKTKTVKISLDSFGSFLGREKGCLVVRNGKGETKRYPLFENAISEIQISSGNTVSAGALATCGFWHIDCLIVTRWGNPIAMVRSLCDDSHVETRICQYEALKNGKGLDIAKQTVIAKLQGQNEVLKKYGLKGLDVFGYSQNVKALDGDLNLVRNRLMSYEGKYSEQYFRQILSLFNESFRPERRKTYKAYDAINNVLNLAYSVLTWKVQIALLKAKLEPYLGFLHHVQFGKSSLICDFEELYRFLIDDFVIGFCRDLKNRDFILKTDNYAGKKDKRQYLNDSKRRDFLSSLDRYFETKVSIARIRRGRKQEIETLISEEAMLFAKYLRNERTSWIPRIVALSDV